MARPILTPGTDRPDTVFVHTCVTSPLGELTLVGSDRGLAAVLWPDDDPRRVPIAPGPRQDDHPVLCETGRQLGEYFAKRRTAFDVPLDLIGTPFQKKVWLALLTIPFGRTLSYGELARRVGHADACRAVGAANGRNPVSIVAPCHRVIGATGRLTGFAGGMGAKAFLLDFEHGGLFGATGGSVQ